MKKIIAAAIVCAFFAAPVYANEFAAAQTKMLGKITNKMAKFEGNAAKIDFLTKKKECVEKATDVAGLTECKAKFNPKTLMEMK
ncbi:MAG TPA: hypothetical protein EYP35_04500 [Desulfobacterales bacterium]|nr:hypothetical protein [Desulfobacterales bacterium]